MCSSGTCQCKAGYEPDSVSVCRAIEAETPPPCTLKCANGGICVVDPVDASQSCACPRNFTGKLCVCSFFLVSFLLVAKSIAYFDQINALINAKFRITYEK